MPYLSALLFIIFAFPEPRMNWSNREAGELRITLPGEQELLNRCIESGLQVSYRFKLRLCRRRAAWFDRCGDTITEIHSMQFDPISESYKVEVDRHGDASDPLSTTVATPAQARELAGRIPNLRISDLGGSTAKLSPKSYIDVRVITDCKGGLDAAMLELSHMLTFGLVKIDRFDSGWVAFKLDAQ